MRGKDHIKKYDGLWMVRGRRLTSSSRIYADPLDASIDFVHRLNNKPAFDFSTSKEYEAAAEWGISICSRPEYQEEQRRITAEMRAAVDAIEPPEDKGTLMLWPSHESHGG